jgi:hypothetical protein
MIAQDLSKRNIWAMTNNSRQQGFVLWWSDEQRLIFSFSIGLLVMGWAEVP